MSRGARSHALPALFCIGFLALASGQGCPGLGQSGSSAGLLPQGGVLTVNPMAGWNPQEPIYAKVGEKVGLVATIAGGQGPYWAVINFSDGSESWEGPANLLISPPTVATDHAFTEAGTYEVKVVVEDGAKMFASTTIYVKVGGSMSEWKSARIWVRDISCQFVSDPPGATSNWMSYEEWWVSETGTYSNGHLSTSWDRIGGIMDWGVPNHGTLTIDFDPQLLLITSFRAEKTATRQLADTQEVTVSTIIGSGVQLQLTDEGGTPVLAGKVTGDQVCTYVTFLSESVEQKNLKAHLEGKSCTERSLLEITISPTEGGSAG